MKKAKGWMIMFLFSFLGLTACGGGNSGATAYEQITAKEAKAIMEAEKDYIISMPAPRRSLPKVT
jgi:hypothetical protein